MAKFVMIALVALMCVSLILASSDEAQACGRHGDLCKDDSTCCKKMKCRPHINSAGETRCQVFISKEEIEEAYNKMFGNKNKN